MQYALQHLETRCAVGVLGVGGDGDLARCGGDDQAFACRSNGGVHRERRDDQHSALREPHESRRIALSGRSRHHLGASCVNVTEAEVGVLVADLVPLRYICGVDTGWRCHAK